MFRMEKKMLFKCCIFFVKFIGKHNNEIMRYGKLVLLYINMVDDQICFGWYLWLFLVGFFKTLNGAMKGAFLRKLFLDWVSHEQLKITIITKWQRISF